MAHETNTRTREVAQEDMWLENPWDALAKVENSTRPEEWIGSPFGDGPLGFVGNVKELRMKASMVDAVVGAAGEDAKAKAGYDSLALADKEGFAMMLASTGDSLIKGSGDTLNMMAHMNAFSTAHGALRAAYAARHGRTELGRKMAQRRYDRKMKKVQDNYLKYGGTGRAVHLQVKK